MTSAETTTACAFCGQPATEAIEPSRRTLARGADPSDPSDEEYSVTVILPDVPLCDQHAQDIRQGDRLVGWCDDPRCRTYGEVGESSACGEPYAKLGPNKRA